MLTILNFAFDCILLFQLLSIVQEEKDNITYEFCYKMELLYEIEL